MINDARARPDADADVSESDVSDSDVSDGGARTSGDGTADAAAPEAPAAAEPTVTGRKTKRKAARTTEAPADDDDAPARRRPSLPLVPVLSVLLVLLLAAAAFLWFTRPESSPVSTRNYVEVLQAARSNVVDFTSFDHLTLDDDIEQVRRVAVGDLRDEAVDQLESRRQEITDSEAIVSTEVIDAGVTRSNDEEATVLLIIQTTRETNASEQAEVVKYRIEVEMQRSDERWVLSAIRGA